MENKKLSRSQKAILKSFNYYVRKMKSFRRKGLDDETCDDLIDFAALESLVARYVDGEKPDVESLLGNFGDEERVELVLSYFNIAKYLLQEGANLDI